MSLCLLFEMFPLSWLNADVLALGRGQRRAPSVTSIRAQVQKALGMCLRALQGDSLTVGRHQVGGRMGFPILRGLCLLKGEPPWSFLILSALKVTATPRDSLLTEYILSSPHFLGIQRGRWAESLAEGRGFLHGRGGSVRPQYFSSTTVALPHFFFSRVCAFVLEEGLCLFAHLSEGLAFCVFFT